MYASELIAKYEDLRNIIGINSIVDFDLASLLQTYDKLSEISHPNGLGTQYLYPATDAPSNAKVVSYYRYMIGMAIWQSHHLLVALDQMTTFPERFVATFPDRVQFSDRPVRTTSGRDDTRMGN